MTDVKEQCKQCGVAFYVRKADWNRQIRRGIHNFFCCRSHACMYGNSLRFDLVYDIEKTCPQCGDKFVTKSGKAERDFCSRGCASAGSVTDYRREKAREVGHRATSKVNLLSPAATLLKREWPKYELLHTYLDQSSCEHEFEFTIAPYVYDLCLLGRKQIVEFDGVEHNRSEQKKTDTQKTTLALANGFSVHRISVTGMKAPYAPEILDTVLGPQ